MPSQCVGEQCRPLLHEPTTLTHSLTQPLPHSLHHCRQGVLAGVRRRGRLLLADDMGLGKTAQVCGGMRCGVV